MLNKLLNKIDMQIDNEKGERDNASPEGVKYYEGRIDGADTARYLIEECFEESKLAVGELISKFEDWYLSLDCDIDETLIQDKRENEHGIYYMNDTVDALWNGYRGAHGGMIK